MTIEPLNDFSPQVAAMFSVLLLALGLIGLMRRRNMLFVLMSVELMLQAPVTLFIALSNHMRTYNGQIFAIFIIMITAAQAAVGVAIVVSLYRHRRSISTAHWTALKG